MAFLYSVLYVAAIGILSHVIGEAIPRRWFCHDRFPYRPWKWEREGKIYDALHVRAWKDRMPDKSKVMKRMVPKRVGKAPRAADVWRLVQETCVAEIVHFALCLCAPVIWLFWRNWIGVVLALVFIICNIPFMIIQRYNRPSLVSLAKRLEKREERRRRAAEQETAD